MQISGSLGLGWFHLEDSALRGTGCEAPVEVALAARTKAIMNKGRGRIGSSKMLWMQKREMPSCTPLYRIFVRQIWDLTGLLCLHRVVILGSEN
jgi:hypothetical protein